MSTRAAKSLSLLVLVALAGCAGSGSPVTGGGGVGTTFEDKAAAANQVAAFVNSLSDGDPQLRSKVSAKMKSIPAFKEVEITESGVCAFYQDGQPYAFLDNRVPVPVPSLPPVKRPKALDLPSVDSYSAANCLGNAFSPQNALVGGWLKDSGYIGVTPTLKVSDWTIFGAHGVTYIDTHGGLVKGKFGLWTADRQGDPVADAANKKYVDEKTVFWFTALHNRVNGKNVSETHYVITPEFIKKYVHFPTASLFFCNACDSNDAAWLTALKQKGLGGYFGWDIGAYDDVAAKAARLVFDRLLGRNAIEPENPPQRPFDVHAIYADLRNRGFLHDARNGNDCRFTELNTTFFILNPTIEHLNVKGYERELEVIGDFGHKQGKVTVGGNEIPVKSWSTSKIVCDLPDSGPGAFGDVQVAVDKRMSNNVALSLWKGNIVYEDRHTGQYRNVVLKCTWHLSIRADIHAYRDMPHGDPTGGSPTSSCDRTSTCTWTATGADGGVAWSGSGTLGQAAPGPITDPDFFRIAYTIDTRFKKIRIGLLAKDSAGITIQGQSAKKDFAPSSAVFDEIPGPYSLPTLVIPFADDWSIPADQRSKDQGVNGSVFTLTWNKMAVASPPDEQDGH